MTTKIPPREEWDFGCLAEDEMPFAARYELTRELCKKLQIASSKSDLVPHVDLPNVFGVTLGTSPYLTMPDGLRRKLRQGNEPLPLWDLDRGLPNMAVLMANMGIYVLKAELLLNPQLFSEEEILKAFKDWYRNKCSAEGVEGRRGRRRNGAPLLCDLAIYRLKEAGWSRGSDAKNLLEWVTKYRVYAFRQKHYWEAHDRLRRILARYTDAYHAAHEALKQGRPEKLRILSRRLSRSFGPTISFAGLMISKRRSPARSPGELLTYVTGKTPKK